MRQQNVIVFSSGKNKRVAHEIARGLDCGVCKAVVWDEFFGKIYGDEYTLTKSYALFPFLVKKIPSFDYNARSDFAVIAKEIDLFRNTLAQFLVPGENGAYHVTAADAEASINQIFIDEITFAEPMDKQKMPWLSAV